MADSPTLSPAMPTSDEVAALLALHGYRLTGPRRAVVDLVLGQDRPFTSEQIVDLAPGIGRATVYRTLEVLASLGVLSRVLRSDGHPAYITGAPGHRHHLVCTDCGATVAFSACPVAELVDDLSRDTRFAIEGHLLEVFGRCPECQHESA
jgi:Fur family transcriptional regulator, ferric uptake regulator